VALDRREITYTDREGGTHTMGYDRLALVAGSINTATGPGATWRRRREFITLVVSSFAWVRAALHPAPASPRKLVACTSSGTTWRAQLRRPPDHATFAPGSLSKKRYRAAILPSRAMMKSVPA
jgi:hypothetical protein